MMKNLILRLLPLVIWCQPVLHAADFAAENKQVDALGQLTVAPQVHPAEGFTSDGDVKAVFFEGLQWKGKPTRVFAWLGVPRGKENMPGVVLVHGGGGTAFKNWVSLWNQRGYAAISIAVEGQTDVRDPANPKAWQRHEWAGPARVGIYGDSKEPLKDQWMYHAVADTILANSLLRDHPQVDADKVGVMGISWGGVITSTVIGIDSRCAFAVPTYGCGGLANARNQYGRSLGSNDLYQKVWDPLVRMDRAKMPTLWFSWPGDEHFPLDCHAANYKAVKGPHMVSLIPGMRHGHGPGWIKPDSYAFAESVVGNGKPWCVQQSCGEKEGTAEVIFTSSKKLSEAILVSTTDKGITGQRTWIENPAELTKRGDEWRATATLPEGTTAWFINVKSGDLTASSDYQEDSKP